MLNVPTSKILQKIADLKKRFNYQNNRFAEEFQEHENQLEKLKALIENKHNEAQYLYTALGLYVAGVN